MADNHSFRSALNGFRREDVVHYIEYLNAQHAAQVAQLTGEMEELRGKLEAAAAQPVQSGEQAPCQNCAQLQAELDTLRSQLLPEPAEGEPLESQELEAYRRAERAERSAKERAAQIYTQATATLAQATTQVDEAALRVQTLVDSVNGHITQLQAAVELSKSALLDAATTMYSIRPEGVE